MPGGRPAILREDRRNRQPQAGLGAMKRANGSISVFLALLLTIFLSAVFSFLELSRVCCLKAEADLCTMQGPDGLMSSYQLPLMQHYGLLFWNGGTGGGLSLEEAKTAQIGLVNAQAATGRSRLAEYALLDLSLDEVDINGYALASDADGAPFRRQAVLAAKQQFPTELMESLKDLLEGKEEEWSEEDLDKIEKQADEALKDAAEAAKGGSEGEGPPAGEAEGGSSYTGSATMEDNPVTWLKKIKKSGILALVTSEENLSEKTINTADLISHRGRNQGTLADPGGESVSDRIWFRLFLQQKYSDYLHADKEGALEYELEYLLAGKDSDQANLKAAVRQLLLMREGVNYLYLLQDQEKTAEALAMALAITSAAGVPVLAEPLKHGILLAWAYAESICDVRILMNQGKVLPVKTSEQWHTDLEHLGSGVSENEGKKQKGLTYSQYLQLLLWTRKDATLTFRAMDLIEKRENIHMDEMVARWQCTYHYSAAPLFWSFVTLGKDALQSYRFETAREFGYDPAA